MVISHAYRFICVAVPKTATTTVEALLADAIGLDRNTILNPQTGDSVGYFLDDSGALCDRHTTGGQLSKIIHSGNWHQNFKFAFVRNPWDKLVSAYHFCRTRPIRQVFGSDPRISFRTRLSFLSAVMLLFRTWARLYPMKSSSSYITSSKGNLLLDYVGRYEGLEMDLGRVFSRLGLRLPTELPKRNRTQHRSYRTYYSRRLQQYDT